MSLGRVILKIRKEKGFNQKYLVKENLTQGTISYFKNNKRDLSSENFIYILDKLNISLEEIQYIANGYTLSPKTMIMKEFYAIQYNDATKLKDLIKKCQLFLDTTKGQNIFHILLISKALLELSIGDNILKAQKIAKPIWDYYQQYDNWYLEDLRILNSILYVFPANDALIISNTLMKRLKKYKDFSLVEDLEISMKINLCMILITDQQYIKAKDLLEYLLSSKKNKMNYQFLALCWNRIMICNKYLGKSDQNEMKSKIDSLLDLFEDQPFREKLHKEYLTLVKE